MKILIVGSDIHLNQKLKLLLQNLEEVQVSGSVVSAISALDISREETPDLVIMGAITADLHEIEAARILKEQKSEMSVILTSVQFNKEFLNAAVATNLDGYLSMEVDSDVICSMIQQFQTEDSFFVSTPPCSRALAPFN